MVSYAKLSKATSEFASSNMIGQGSFGYVYKGILGEDEMIVAVKVINLKQKGAFRRFVTECEALRNIRHRNLIKIITICSSIDFNGVDFKALVFEYMENRSLEDWLHQSNDQVEGCKLSLIQRVNMAVDVSSAIEYLHHHCQLAMVHGDLKPSNILLDRDMVSHVGDFGLAKFLSATTLILLIKLHQAQLGLKEQLAMLLQAHKLSAHGSSAHELSAHGLFAHGLSAHRLSAHGLSAHGLSAHGLSAHGLFAHGLSAHRLFAHGSSVHEFSAHGSSAHGSSAHGLSAHGLSAHGSSVHGSSTYGLSAHGLSAHGSSAHGLSAHGLFAHGLSAHRLFAHGLSAHEFSAHGSSAHGSSAHGLSAYGLSAHGSSVHGSSAYGLSAHGLSAHGSSAHGSSAHGLSTHGLSAHGTCNI
ncbi:hypothetical protein WN943_023374 [Citrus x changshan-huyou]